MWYTVYNLLLAVLLVGALPLLPLVALMGERYRAGLGQRFGFYPKALLRELASQRPLWIHAASVGEVRSAEPLARALKARAPERKLLLSTFTATGNRIARKISCVDAVIYLPLDFPGIPRRALRAFDPSLLVIIETEIWPNLLRAAHRRGTTALLLSGRISERAFGRYVLARGFFRRVLQCFTGCAMQSAADARRLVALGADEEKVSVVGSLKFAGDFASNNRPFPEPGGPLLVAGSTHRGEEAVVLQAFRRARERFPELLLVLAPRHPERFGETERLLQESSFDFARKSRCAPSEYFSREVLLLDSVGELPQFFAQAAVAFIGGSLVEVGGHNALEPARSRKPILFGPHMANFREIAEELKRRKAAVEVRDAEELARALIDLLGNEEKRRQMGERAAEAAGVQADALERNLELVQRYL